MNIKVVVTGGAGFVGSHLVDALIEKNFDVHIVDNLYSGSKENLNDRAIFHNTDVRDIDSLATIFKGSQYIFHLAALVGVPYSIKNPIETDEVNFGGTRNILKTAIDAKVKRVVIASSAAVYGDTEKIPTVEIDQIDPKSPYAAQKYLGELYCRLWSKLYGLETVALRFFNVYGPRQDPKGEYAGVISKFLHWSSTGKVLKITGSGDQTRDFVHVTDVVSALLCAMTSERVGSGEAINIGSGIETSINDLARTFGGETEHVAARVEIKNSRSEIFLAKELLGWSPRVSLERGISGLLESLK